MFWVKKHQKKQPKGGGLWEEHEVMTLRLMGHQDPSLCSVSQDTQLIKQRAA